MKDKNGASYQAGGCVQVNGKLPVYQRKSFRQAAQLSSLSWDKV